MINFARPLELFEKWSSLFYKHLAWPLRRDKMKLSKNSRIWKNLMRKYYVTSNLSWDHFNAYPIVEKTNFRTCLIQPFRKHHAKRNKHVDVKNQVFTSIYKLKWSGANCARGNIWLGGTGNWQIGKNSCAPIATFPSVITVIKYCYVQWKHNWSIKLWSRQFGYKQPKALKAKKPATNNIMSQLAYMNCCRDIFLWFFLHSFLVQYTTSIIC